jgi:hypothetical protein
MTGYAAIGMGQQAIAIEQLWESLTFLKCMI